MKRRLRANVLLLLAALFWGSTFAAQRVAAGTIAPFPFQGIRCLLGAALLYLAVPALDRFLPGGTWRSRALWIAGLLCGLCLFSATNLQQFGISLGTTAGKSGFITALYIVLVPVFGVFLRRRSGPLVWISVALAVAGLFFLCVDESLSLAKGDFVTLLCAVCFAAQIAASWFPIVYAGVFSSALAYTFQIIAQRDTNPTVASILMSTESVFAVLSGWLVLGERLSGRESLGCALMFCAVLLSQLPDRRKADA